MRKIVAEPANRSITVRKLEMLDGAMRTVLLIEVQGLDLTAADLVVALEKVSKIK